MNKCIVIGRLTKDPEAYTTQGGVSRSNFTLAVQRDHRNANGTYDADFLNIVAWRQTADYVNRYMHKGSMVAVEGKIQTRNYETQDGTKRYVTEIIADSIQGLDRKDNTQQGARQEQPAAPAQPASADDFTEVEDSELPFKCRVMPPVTKGKR